MTETIDKLFLELSLVTSASTSKEIELRNTMRGLLDVINESPLGSFSLSQCSDIAKAREMVKR